MAEQPGGPDAARLCWPRLRVPPITPPGARFRSRFTAPPFFRWARPPPAHCDGRASPRGIRGSKGPQASPLSAWMLTQARWATHGDAVRVCSLSRARPSGPSGPPLLTWVPAGAFPFCATFHGTEPPSANASEPSHVPRRRPGSPRPSARRLRTHRRPSLSETGGRLAGKQISSNVEMIGTRLGTI